MSHKLRWPVFWALVGVFLVIVGFFAISVFGELLRGWWFLIPFALFCLLGIALVVLAARDKSGGKLRAFFILTGASAAGILVGVLLHNLIYGLFEYLGGPDFWNGGDEPVFFIIAVIVCPLGFLVGTVGTIVLGIKGRARRSP